MLDKLSILNAPHAVVIRDGKRQEIPADQLVLDDIVEFFGGKPDSGGCESGIRRAAGERILITGESDEIENGGGFSAFRKFCGIRKGMCTS